MAKKLCIIILFSFCIAADFTVMFWNVENLFDIYDDPKTKDGDFMPGGAKRYTYRSYCLKTQHLADVINYIDPDVFAMVEVENRPVLEDLSTYLQHTKEWGIIIDDGPDIRGIDPALMYRKDRACFVECTYYPVFIEARGYHSRPIMRVDLALLESNDTMSIFINHWPSRRGGKPVSDPYRLFAAEVLVNAVRETQEEHPKYPIIMTGDFNDDACDTCLKYLYGQPGIKYLEKRLPQGVNGTYCHNGEWIHFDHFLCSGFLTSNVFVRETSVVAPSWVRDKSTNGPLRFYNGMEILGGYSDHFAICLKLGLKTKCVE